MVEQICNSYLTVSIKYLKKSESQSEKKEDEVIAEMITVIKKGCPICGRDIYGNKKAKYLCRRCFVFFEEKHIKKGLFAR
jgi:transposase-like protein